MVVWKERGEKGLCLCPEAGEDVTPELEDLWRFHGVTGLCLEGGSGLTGEEKMSMEGIVQWGCWHTCSQHRGGTGRQGGRTVLY